MKPNQDESIIKFLIKKVKNPICVFIIIVLYFINNYIQIIKANELAIAICIILICIVLLKETIYNCLDRLCKRDENIEKEKTKRLLATDNGKNDDDPSPNDKNDSSSANRSSNTQDNNRNNVCNIKDRRPS